MIATDTDTTLDIWPGVNSCFAAVPRDQIEAHPYGILQPGKAYQEIGGASTGAQFAPINLLPGWGLRYLGQFRARRRFLVFEEIEPDGGAVVHRGDLLPVYFVHLNRDLPMMAFVAPGGRHYYVELSIAR